MSRLRWGQFIFVVFCLAALSSPAQGQTKNPNNDGVLQQLLEEVRSLRQTLQRANLYAYRGQIIVERIRLQQDRVERLSTALENTKSEIHQLELQDPSLDDRLKELNETLEKLPSTARGEIESEIKVVKQAVSSQKQREDELRQKASELTVSLGDEQAKLDSLEKKLNALEVDLERATEGPKPN